MTLRYSEKLRNGGLHARIAAIGPSPTLHLFDASGKQLALIRLPKEWMGKPEGGIARKRGVWSGVAEAKGKPARFDIRDAEGETHITGAIPGEMTIDKPADLEAGSPVVIGNFTLAAGNR